MNTATTAEHELSLLTGRSFCTLTSRGTIALYALLKAFKKKTGPGKVIVPAIICPSVPNAVVYSGYKPVFCDVQCSDLNASPESVSALLEEDPSIRGIIAVDLYGCPGNLDALAKAAGDHDAFMIEDVAQALGGTCKKRPLGSFGDAAILSFGHTKIIDNAQAGAIVTDNDQLIRRVQAIQKTLPEYLPGVEARKQLYTKVYYALQPLVRDDRLDELHQPLPGIFKDIYLYRKSRPDIDAEADKIIRALKGLPGYIAQRRKNAGLYRSLLDHKDIVHPEYSDEGCVFWRYSFLVKQHTQELTTYIRSRGYDISNWYPPVYRWYPSSRDYPPNFFCNAEYVGSHIINLWTEPKTPQATIRNICSEITAFLERYDTG